MRYFKEALMGTLIWMLLFAIDYIIEVLQITKIGVHITLFGAKITTGMIGLHLNPHFSITWYALLSYLICMVLWFLILKYLSKKKTFVQLFK